MPGLFMIAVSMGMLAAAPDYPVKPVPFTAVRVDQGFWAPRLETNRTVTIPFDFKKCEETGRIKNFAVAGRLEPGEFKGIFFDDSDVYKVIEGASYSLSLHPDAELERYLDDVIAKIAAAQEDDGYLYTYRTSNANNQEKIAKDENLRDGRWAHLEYNHELYNLGHLYEAAVAHYQATGKRSLLDVALKSADLVCSVFGPDKRIDVPGHEEIEMGLVKLYRVTGDEKYLRQAKFFVDARGSAKRAKLYGPNLQDHEPVLQQEKVVGHAVRAGYLFAGMTDVAALTGDAGYVETANRLWQDVVSTKLSITGGVGARREGEAYGAAYELPNKEAYNETCAAIALALWNQRMFLLQPDAKYFDVIERILYNGFLAGVGFSGDRFFYPNPLEADGETKFNHGSAERQPWFGTSCCPTNVARFLPSLLGWVYAQKDNALYVNLFMDSTAEFEHAGGKLKITQTTRYPWEGEVTITLTPDAPRTFPVLVRMPGWARHAPVPSNLYRYLMPPSDTLVLINGAIDGTAESRPLENDYMRFEREWKAGDTITLRLPMPVQGVVAHEKVEADRGKVALERGPVVYCVEGADNTGDLGKLELSDAAEIRPEWRPELLGGVTVLRSETPGFIAIPYYAWGHRGANAMRVWLARSGS